MKREGNEDSYLALLGRNAPVDLDALLVVADGMGGHQAGEVASSLAVRGLRDRIEVALTQNTENRSAKTISSLLISAIQSVNSDINLQASKPDTRGMGTTLTAAMVFGAKVVVAQVGDSRAYIMTDGTLRQLTKDHSWVNEEVERGNITLAEAKIHPRRNVLTRAVGIAPKVDVDTLSIDVKEGDVLCLCSDGLYGLVDDEDIQEVLTTHSPSEASRILVDRANELGGHDNITVIVAQMNSCCNATQSSTSDIHNRSTVQIGNVAQTKRQKTLPSTSSSWISRFLRRFLGS